MAGQLPSFLSSSQLQVRIGAAQIAYAQNLSFSDDMQVQPVGGIGGYSFHQLEPTGYLGRGSMTITHYSDAVLNALNSASQNNLPDNIKGSDGSVEADGNSFLRSEYFNPVRLMISQSFDIDVYERGYDAGAERPAPTNGGSIVYTLRNCRLTNYNIGFTPGSLVNENISFLCTSILDHRSEEINKDQEGS